MTLQLVFDDTRATDDVAAPPVVLLPLLPGAGIEPFAAALFAIEGRRRRVFPCPGSDPSPATMRDWHRDLWWALPAADRRALTFASGPGAACLAPAIGANAEVIAIVRDPVHAIAALGAARPKAADLQALDADGEVAKMSRLRAFANRQSAALLAASSEGDDLPVSIGPPADADRWRALLFGPADAPATGLQLVRADDLASVALQLAKRLGAPVKRTIRLAEELVAQPREELHGKPARVARLTALSWLDVELYERAAPARSIEAQGG